MARGSKVVINRAALDQTILAVADGLYAVAVRVVESARPADSPYEPYPTGEGLPRQGGALAYVHGKKVAGMGLDGRQPRAPRALKVSRTRGVVVVAGFGFPGRFVEMGTVRTAAQPFLTPAFEAVSGQAQQIMREAAGPNLPRPGP